MSNLSGTNLNGANLDEVCLSAVDLSGANFIKPQLSRAKLNKADLREADLSEADLRGAHLRAAKYSPSTIWPAGFDVGSSGALLSTEPSSPNSRANRSAFANGSEKAELRIAWLVPTRISGY